MKKNIRKFSGNNEKELDQYSLQKLNNYKARFNVWQGRQIDLLNWSIGILITLNVAAIGYWINLETDQKFGYLNIFCILTNFIALIMLCIALILGTIILWIRLNDFRGTLNIVRLKTLKFKVVNKLTYFSDKEEDENKIEVEIENIRYKTQRLGIITHRMFKTHLCFFILGLLIIILSVL